MGKVKSAIITALVVAAVLILSLFATISCPLNEVERYNSFISSIHMGSDLTGEAYALFYPEGVISPSDYWSVVNDEGNPNREEYMSGYNPHPTADAESASVFVENEQYGPDKALLGSVAKDAEIISARFAQKGYSKYSVSVVDGYVIKVSVPTNFTYSAFKGYDATARSEELTKIGNTIKYLTLSGELDLKNGQEDTAKTIIPVSYNGFETFFSGANYYGVGGNHVVQIKLNDEGYKNLNNIIGNLSDGTGYFFVGKTCIGLQLTYGENITGKTLNFQVGEASAKDYSIVLDSVINGNTLTNNYNHNGEKTEVIAITPSFGESAVVWLFVLLLLALIGAIAISVVKYKKLGLVNGLIAVAFSAIMITAILLTGIQLTVAGAFILVLGLALLTFSNFRVFEAVRKETLTGRTIQASVKTGYKKSLTTILDLHIVILVAAALFALICTGELAACGLILFIATIASYVLHWFTRFMWFVISSPVKDKFKFCGYKREVLDDED
ncbi:MAG: hypothetical protein K2O28_02245 [Clostridia bacterium]|nr:hypothetical protein [Clostridia bacterium]